MSHLIVSFLIGIASFFGYVAPTQSPVYGAYSPTGGGTYRTGQSLGTSDTSVKLSSFKEPVSNIPYTMSYLGSDIEYGTISPQSSISEFVSFSGITQNSDGSATLTGVLRGLSRTPGTGGCVASTTLAQAHAGQSVFILSNPPCQLAEYLTARTTATSSGPLVFDPTTLPPRYSAVGVQGNGSMFSTTSELASVAYVNATALVSAPNASETTKGVSELATQLEMGSSTITGSTGANLTLQSKYATTTPWNRNNYIVITRSDSTIDPLFISTSSAYTWANLFTTGSTTIPANASNKLTLNGFSMVFPGSSGASSSVLMTNGSGLFSWLPVVRTLSTNSPNTSTGSAATTTLQTVAIPANTITSTQSLRVGATWVSTTNAGNCNYGVTFGNGTATTTIGYANQVVVGGAGNGVARIDGNIIATSTTNGLATMFGNQFNTSAVVTGGTSVLAGYLSYTFSGLTYIAFTAYNQSATACVLASYSVEVVQ